MAGNILVTGGAGYIGSHVCKALARSGFTPVVYDDLSGGYRSNVRWGPLVIGDLMDSTRLDAAFRSYRPSAVVHLAGFIAAGESVQDPAKYYGNNLVGTLALLEVMQARGVKALVFSSSAAVYGDVAEMPIDETAAIQPSNPYGHTKAMTEQFLQDYARNGLRSVSLRYFNAAGADPEGELGELHEPETHLIPLVLEAAAGLRPRIDIYGTDHPTPDGTCIRDYIHVSDLADAHVLAVERLRAGGGEGAEAYNLGNGCGFSVREVIEAAERVTGRRVPLRECGRRPGDPPRLIADPGRAIADLGWRQKHSELETQIAHAWAFLKQRIEGESRAAG
ncbi:MAG: UDP-glucose 4-epimerase GalE [Rhodovibrionaceae bacterium]